MKNANSIFSNIDQWINTITSILMIIPGIYGFYHNCYHLGGLSMLLGLVGLLNHGCKSIMARWIDIFLLHIILPYYMISCRANHYGVYFAILMLLYATIIYWIINNDPPCPWVHSSTHFAFLFGYMAFIYGAVESFTAF